LQFVLGCQPQQRNGDVQRATAVFMNAAAGIRMQPYLARGANVFFDQFGTFSERVFFLQPSSQSQEVLRQLNGAVSGAFRAAGVTLHMDSGREFNPHMTLLKASFSRTRYPKRRDPKKKARRYAEALPLDVASDSTARDDVKVHEPSRKASGSSGESLAELAASLTASTAALGVTCSQPFDTLSLCSMVDPRSEDGFYRIVAQWPLVSSVAAVPSPSSEMTIST